MDKGMKNMNINDAITKMTQNADITKSDLAKELGFSKPSGVLGPISKARNYGMGMKVESLIRWVHQLGYDLVLQPAGCTVEGQLVLGNEAKTRQMVVLQQNISNALKSETKEKAPSDEGAGNDTES